MALSIRRLTTRSIRIGAKMTPQDYGRVVASVIAADRDVIAYRPHWASALGSVTAALLLQQIFFRWQRYGDFYKFKEPCEHPLYKVGDSWCEEMGLTRHEYDSALKRIGQKLCKGSKKDYTALVHYWTNADRVTYFRINEQAFNAFLSKCYPFDLTPDSGFTYKEPK
jgi:hypothetical protein